MIIKVNTDGYVSGYVASGYNYPYPELAVSSLDAYAQVVYIDTVSDSAGDSAAYIDFEIKINGIAATITSLTDGGDSRIVLNISETITAGQTITLTYVPNSARWILAPSGSPAYVLFAMTNAVVTNNT